MVEFRSSGEFESWLNKLPDEWQLVAARVLSLRAALRVLPFTMPKVQYFAGLGPKTFHSQRIVFITCRGSILPLAIALKPSSERELKPAASSLYLAKSHIAAADATAAYDPIEAKISYSAYAATAVAATTAASVASAAVRSAVYVTARVVDACAAPSTVYVALSADATEMQADWSKAADVLTRPLWSTGQPDWAKKATAHFLETLQKAGDDWDVWARWYQDRLDGVPPDPDFILAIARIPEADWDKGPAHVNAIIKRLEEARKRPEEAGKAFFISYASNDEAKAREIAGILDEAGHSTFAMFKDIPPGANFVTEMQRGLMATLADKGRVVALYSPAYVASDHCQAEWNTAYAADPSGTERTLLPFLIHPTELWPLARQGVYKSLVGLNRAETKVAILASLGIALPAIPNVKAAFDVRLNEEGRLAAYPGPLARMVLPQPGSAQDKRQRLQALQVLTDRLLAKICEGGGSRYQVRPEYREYLQELRDWMPGDEPEAGNIILADACCRNLRALFQAEARELSVAFSAPLKVILENFQGLRVYYPEMGAHYEDIRTGSLTTPLPLDACEGFIGVIRDFTPSHFDPSVQNAAEASTAPAPPAPPSPAAPMAAGTPMPPPDPLGEVDPQKARDKEAGSYFNAVVKGLENVEKAGKAVEGFDKVKERLAPFWRLIREWLTNSSGDGPPMPPPTILT